MIDTTAQERRPLLRRPLVVALRVLLAAVFLSSGIAKVLQPEEFARGIYFYKLLPIPASNLTAATLPWVEIVCGLLLLSGVFLYEAALLAAAMLVVFTAAVALSWMRGFQGECGCQALFFEENIGLKKILENLALTGLCLALLFHGWRAARSTALTPEGRPHRASRPGEQASHPA